MATYEYNLNAVIGKLHDAAKNAADKKVNSLLGKLKRMKLEFGEGDILDNTGIVEEKTGSLYRGPGKYEIRFVRGGIGTMLRFKDYMAEYMKWFAGIDDFDITDYASEDDEGDDRYFAIPYLFVEGKFQAAKAEQNDEFEGADDTEEITDVDDDLPEENAGIRKIKDAVAKKSGIKTQDIDKLTVLQLADVTGDEVSVDTLTGIEQEDDPEKAEKAADKVIPKIKVDKVGVQSVIDNADKDDTKSTDTIKDSVLTDDQLEKFENKIILLTNITKESWYKLRLNAKKDKQPVINYLAKLLNIKETQLHTLLKKCIDDDKKLTRFVTVLLFGNSSNNDSVKNGEKRRQKLQKALGMSEVITNKAKEDSLTSKTKTDKEVVGLENTVKDRVSKAKGGSLLKETIRALVMTVGDFKDFCKHLLHNYDVDSRVSKFTSDQVLVATYFMTQDMVHATGPLDNMNEQDEYKVFADNTEKNPDKKNQDRYYVKIANAGIIQAFKLFTSATSFYKVLRVKKSPKDKAGDANKNVWDKIKIATKSLFKDNTKPVDKELNMGIVFAEYQPTDKNPNAKPIKEVSMNENISKLVKAVVSEDKTEARNLLKKIIKEKAKIRFSSISDKENCK